MKKYISTIALMFMLSLSLILAGCGGGRENELISVNLSSYLTHQTKTIYYAGDEFSSSETCVAVKYYDKETNTETTLNTPLNKLSEKGFTYTVSGFNSQTAVESQTISITITSDKYSGEVSVHYTIEIFPEFVVSSEVVNASTLIKDVYVVDEQLPLSQMQVRNVYSNDRIETINVTSEMVTGFDTSVASASYKTFTINSNGKELKFYYMVAPAQGYELFTNGSFKCFRPSTEQGFALATSDLFSGTKRYKSSYGAVEFAYYELAITYSETGIQSFFNRMTGYSPSISSLTTGESFNGVSAAVCNVRFTSGALSSKSYKAVFFTTASNGQLSKQNFFILFENYSNVQMKDVINNVLSSVKK